MVASALSGQTALIPLPSSSSTHEQLSLTNISTIIPVQLKLNTNGTSSKKKGTGSGVLGNGMDVIKVAENGKRQARRVAITPDGRVLLISTEKVSVRNLIRKRSIRSEDSSDSFKKIEISSIDRVVRGQSTTKFLSKPKNAPLSSIPVKEERISLSIVFRINTASTNLTAEQEDLTITTDSSNSWASLDLIIPSHNDYELLIRTLKILIDRNGIYKSTISRDILLLQHHWMDMGKPLSSKILENTWTTLCIDRLSVPVRKSALSSLYQKFCQASSSSPDDGVTLPMAVGMLEHTRKLTLHMENKVDPCDVIWNILSEHNQRYEMSKPVYDSDDSDNSTMRVQKEKMKKNSGGDMISAEAFLKFMQLQQKNSKATLSQVKDLFGRLNSIATPSQIMDDGVTRKPHSTKQSSFSQQYISKAVFLNYILSDSNDAFDPDRGNFEQDDMTQPLCSYWINASHDTYLSEAPPHVVDSLCQKNFADCPVNVKMYATALYRGCRCLELDVWDGQSIQKGQPVIKFDSVKIKSNHPRTSDSFGNPQVKAEPILFADVLWLVRSFLLSNPTTLPVLLFIESHCTLPMQERMADDISNILGDDNMVFIPRGSKGDVLPSPHEMRGKVVIKFKIAEGNSKSVAFDDYDEDNDLEFDASESNHDDAESVVSNDLPEGKSPRELEADAAKALFAAKKVSKEADEDAFEAKVKANRAKEIANELLKRANMTTDDAEKELRKKKATKNPELKVQKKPKTPPSETSPTPKTPKKMTPPTQAIPKVKVETKQPQSWTQFFFGGGEESEDEHGDSINEVCEYSDSDEEHFSSDDGEIDDEDDELEQEQTHRNPNFSMIDDSDDKSDSDSDYESDNRSEGWVESSPEYRKFKEAERTKKVEEEIFEDIKKIEKKLDGFKQHKEDDGIEVEHYYSNKVDHGLMEYSEIEKKNEQANQIVEIATEVLEKCKREYEKANFDMKKAKKQAQKNKTEAQKKKNDVENRIKSSREKDFNDANEQTLKAQNHLEQLQLNLANAQQDNSVNQKNAKELQDEMNSLKQAVAAAIAKVSTARTVGETAASEAKLSEERKLDIQDNLNRAEEDLKVKSAIAEQAAKNQEKAAKRVETERRVLEEVTKNFKAAKVKWQVISDGLEKVQRQIRDIERSSAYHRERKQAQMGILEHGDVLKKHKAKIDEKFAVEEKCHKAAREKVLHEEKVKQAEKYLDEALKDHSEQKVKAAQAHDDADHTSSLVERLSEQLEEDKDAAKMRKQASGKASTTLQHLESELTRLTSKLRRTEIESNEADQKAQSSQTIVAKLQRETDIASSKYDTLLNTKNAKAQIVAKKINANVYIPGDAEGLDDHLVIVEKKRKQLRHAEKAYKRATEVQQWTENELEVARNELDKNADVYYKAKIDATLLESRIDAKQKLVDKALRAYEHQKQLAHDSIMAKEYASKCHSNAEDKAVAHRLAQDYSRKKAVFHPISMNLSKMTMLHSAKFQYFEKSKVLPFNYIHNFSEGKIYKLYEHGLHELDDLIQFNKTHLTRVFPSKHESLRSESNNYNPVLAWSLGCQIASMNQQLCDAFILVNDGRFRVNGSCGYVLKPESMIERKGGDIRRRTAENLPTSWTIKILSGYNLPKPRKKALSGMINPRVRVTLYDGKQNVAPLVHVTDTVKKNGLNPVWDEKTGSNFKVNDPSTAIVLISLWDVDGATYEEDFIAAAAIPISCMRQGYRSIPLFDANHMRCGSHASTMLLARIDAK